MLLISHSLTKAVQEFKAVIDEALNCAHRLAWAKLGRSLCFFLQVHPRLVLEVAIVYPHHYGCILSRYDLHRIQHIQVYYHLCWNQPGQLHYPMLSRNDGHLFLSYFYRYHARDVHYQLVTSQLYDLSHLTYVHAPFSGGRWQNCRTFIVSLRSFFHQAQLHLLF